MAFAGLGANFLPDGRSARPVVDLVYPACGHEPLPISLEHAIEAGRLALPHRDPFDRMLAAQARLERIPLISDDQVFASLSVSFA
jgi:PIN domain nuclease of toxin-antitoxin system